MPLPEFPAMTASADPKFAVELDLPASAANFAKTWQNVSWSKLKTFGTCQTSWFFENFAVPMHRQVYSEDSAAAIPGTITQRIWEALINDRVHLRFGNQPEQLALWCQQQTTALFHTLVMPMEAQFELPRESIRKFFKTPLGQQRLQYAYDNLGLDPVFKNGIQPKFTDFAKFTEKHGSIESFLRKLGEQYPLMLARFASMDVDLTRMTSEQFIKAKFGSYELRGGVDFLYNRLPMNTFLNKPAELQEGYILLDGKAQVHDRTPTGQLFFYATILYLCYKKLPSHVGFIDWSKSDLVWVPFSLQKIEDTKRAVSLMQGTAYKLNEALTKLVATGRKTISVYELPYLGIRADRMGCMFCGMNLYCEKAAEFNYGRLKDPAFVKGARAVPEGLDRSNITDGLTEVTF